MTDNRELRHNWRTNWLRSIQEFADLDAQRRLWLSPTNPHSFVEYFCCYFDDLGLSDGGYDRALTDGLVTSEEVRAVKEFHNEADAYESPTDDFDHESILADSKWAAVVAAARHAQRTLEAMLQDPRERQLLTEPTAD